MDYTLGEVRITYDFDSPGYDSEHFGFRVAPEPSGRRLRTLYAPDEELEGEATIREGRVVVTSLTVEREQGLNARSLRQVPLAGLRDQLERDLLVKREREGERAAFRALRSRSLERGAADDFYRDVAIAYLATLARSPRQPIKALLRELRKAKRHANLSESTVASWVRAARAAEWLTPAAHGKPGADPGPRLIEWQRKKEEDDG